MTLREAIERECTVSYELEDMVKGTPDFFDEKQKEEFIEYMNRLPEELEHCRKQAQKDRRLYQKMQELIYKRKYSRGELKRILAQTTEYNDYLDHAHAMEYVKDLIQTESSAVIQDLYKVSDDEIADLKEITKNMIQYLEKMEQGITEAKEYISKRLPVVWEKAKQPV